MCITFIGSLVIIIKKVASRQITQRIPKSNILPQPTNYQQQSFQMATLHHSTPGVRTINEDNTGDLSLLCQSSPIQQTKKLFAVFL